MISIFLFSTAWYNGDFMLNYIILNFIKNLYKLKYDKKNFKLKCDKNFDFKYY